MKGKMLFVLLALALASFGVANADPTSNATAHVYVNVDPNIAVSATTPSPLPNVQTGDFGCDVIFRIDANTQQVSVYAVVSYLYKGDDCVGTSVSPILLNLQAGVPMRADNANPTNGHSHTAQYTTPLTQGQCFAGYRTESVVWESSQNNHFSQGIILGPIWNQSDPEKPMGQYSGFVTLFAMVVVPGAV